MIIKQYDAVCDERYLTAYGLNPEKTLYFDIESTGLSPARSHLYLIGAAVKNPSAAEENRAEAPWTVYQYFSEAGSEEAEILALFNRLCRNCSTLVQFNGDRFDIPYLKGRAEALGMPSPLEGMQTLDLYREIRPLKQMLGLKKLNQKTVEDFLGIERQDRWSGGELIDVYRAYRDRRDILSEADRNRERLSMLLLHNYEDVLGMLKLTPLLSYPLLLDSMSPAAAAGLQTEVRGKDDLNVSFCLDLPVPVPVRSHVSCSPESAAICREISAGAAIEKTAGDCPENGTGALRGDPSGKCPDDDNSVRHGNPCVHSGQDIPFERGREIWSVSAEGTKVQLRIPFREGTLRHFFKDYKNYYYLPEEDTALHRSVAAFVDPLHRRKASADNCYVKKQGLFLPQPAELCQPAFRDACRDRLSWFEWKKQPSENPDLFSSYIHSLVRAAFMNK